jgi:hypothetical protein
MNEVDAITHPPFGAYKERLEADGGRILQLNRVGALTVVTGYRGLGQFECVHWDDRHPDHRHEGVVVSYWETLQTAEAFHFAYLKKVLAGPWGKELRERGKYMADAAKEAYAELKSDKELFKDYDWEA